MKYESPITYHSKDTENVKSFCGQTDKQRDGQAKNYMPPIFRYNEGIKMSLTTTDLYSHKSRCFLNKILARVLHNNSSPTEKFRKWKQNTNK
jgi:hypothetical protein